MKLDNNLLKDWIVEDLQIIFNDFNDDRYSIFNDITKLDYLADNIKSLVKQS